MGDPFANDPFFSEPFGTSGGIDKMIDKMHKSMKMQMSGAAPDSMLGRGAPGGGGNGRFAQMQQITKTRADRNGNPVTETYQTRAQGATGGGQRVTERH